MALKTSALVLLLLGLMVPQSLCQHWSYGLNPGGKRELSSLSDTFGSRVERFPHVDTPCSTVGCAEESQLAKIYRMKGLLVSKMDKEHIKNENYLIL
uniref:Progonadoliberin n=1 Tax=Sphaeramia orbicularis TaxID=375764 RepID=A0A673C9S5_9TELE